MDLSAAGFGGELTDVIPELRQMAESRMLDEFDIKMPNGTTYNPATKKDEQTFTFLFSTCGRVKVKDGLSVREAEVGSRTSASVVRELHIPVDSETVPAGAVAELTSRDCFTDPSLPEGSLLVLEGPAPGSQTTARRMSVTEVLT